MKPDRATLEDLIRRVQEATGPDRELDAAIMFDLFAEPVGKRDDGPSGYIWPEDNASWSFGLRFPGKDRAWFARPQREETLLIWRDDAWVLMNQLRVPCLTASVDAALALVERVLPGWFWEVNNGSRGTDGTRRSPYVQLAEPITGPFGPGVGIRAQVNGATPPLAILAALLRALASEASHD